MPRVPASQLDTPESKTAGPHVRSFSLLTVYEATGSDQAGGDPGPGEGNRPLRLPPGVLFAPEEPITRLGAGAPAWRVSETSVEVLDWRSNHLQ